MEEILHIPVVVSKCMNTSTIGALGHHCLFGKNISNNMLLLRVPNNVATQI